MADSSLAIFLCFVVCIIVLAAGAYGSMYMCWIPDPTGLVPFIFCPKQGVPPSTTQNTNTPAAPPASAPTSAPTPAPAPQPYVPPPVVRPPRSVLVRNRTSAAASIQFSVDKKGIRLWASEDCPAGAERTFEISGDIFIPQTGFLTVITKSQATCGRDQGICCNYMVYAYKDLTYNVSFSLTGMEMPEQQNGITFSHRVGYMATNESSCMITHLNPSTLLKSPIGISGDVY